MRRLALLLPIAPFFLLALSACSGGGAGSDARFNLLDVSVREGAVWQINRPIRLTFDADVDFASVNLNTIHVARVGGAPATGSFFPEGPRTVVFQPVCPTLDDDSDAGLLPGGVSYRIDIPGVGSGAGGETLRSVAGVPLTYSFSAAFVTPDSIDPAVLFIDVRPGPPAPVIRTDPTVADACYLEIGEDPENRVYLLPRAQPDGDLGADVPAGFSSGLNLHADASTRVAIVLAIDQPVHPSAQSVLADAVRLEYQDAAGAWVRLAHAVELVANCTGSGARLRVTPIGILPQNHLVRTLLSQDFVDLVGEGNPLPLVVGTFLVGTATDPGGTTPGDGADEWLEDFTTNGGEDPDTPLAAPRAEWGRDGSLRAGFAFDGTGGPDGTFDWQLGHDLPGVPEILLLDTSFAVITNVDQTVHEYVIDGRVDVHNFTVGATGTLTVQGPNPLRILASGSVRIDGTILVVGGSSPGVNTLGGANIPEPGAPGQAGGGRGGTGSYLSTQSTPLGQSGCGAFNVPDAGGFGGESGFNPNPEPDGWRRAGGGGGGTFGRDLLRPSGVVPGYTNPNACPDQSFIGLDAEPGFPGAPTARGALHPGEPPRGGDPGPRPFFDGDPENDFWGTMRKLDGTVLHGELPGPLAGAGGGAGGNSITSATFPPPWFDPNSDEKGSGGGGGGGSITILALGDITLGPSGRIDASGGTGGGGEDQFPVFRIAGGSGGGSGGHIVLQTASHIDLSRCRGSGISPGGLYALGGQGGEGADNRGGSHFSVPTTVHLDALPAGSYPNTTAPCGVVASQAGYDFDNTVGNADPTHGVVCCGGDGGPGIVQLHAPSLADILTPSTLGESIFTICKPPPIGSTPVAGVPSLARIVDPSQWNQLLPIFGRASEALSKWVQLGAASVGSDPSSDAPEVVHLAFAGTTPEGYVATTGSGPTARVALLPPILAGNLQPGSTPPYVASDRRAVVFDATAIVDDIYLRSPSLLRGCDLRLTHGPSRDFDVAAATYDPATHLLTVTVEGGGAPLGSYFVGDPVDLRPRFFSVITGGVHDSLPSTSRITIEFQATTPNAQGDPASSAASAWVRDLARLDPNLGTNPDYRFFRFRIGFDISVDGAPLTFDTPVPNLDFFRMPFRF